MTPRLQGVGDPGEERRDRTLQEQEDLAPPRLRGASVLGAGILAGRFDVSHGISTHGHTSGLGGAGGRRRPAG